MILRKGLWAFVGVVWPKIDPETPNPIDPNDPSTAIIEPDPETFKDPTTWAAWDAVAFMLGSPWALPKPMSPDETKKDFFKCD
ncbi:MAG: hypothetical protein MZV65_27140 [Chromatiales bacterium]|nr:hypothetical protein [Chromatiales bacterium]